MNIDEAELREILNERDQLRRQREELQARMTEMVNGSLYRTVGRFHQKYGHPVNHTPRVPDEAQVRFRLRLITEEYLELLGSCIPLHSGQEHVAERLQEIVDREAVQVNLSEMVDAMCDLEWVIEGTRLVFGVRGEPVLREVERANMSKGPNEKDGKPTKPSDWRPPDIAGVLRKQGWRG